MRFLSLLLSIFITNTVLANVELVVLGVAQDAGYPQINCYQPHCMSGWEDKEQRKLATSLAIIDTSHKAKYLFEATPNMPEQLYKLNLLASDLDYKLGGVFLTHAHIGHYTGLMFFGREAAGTQNTPVYAMPQMSQFLTNNGPWSQLISLQNIKLNALIANNPVKLNNVIVTPFTVPHRDEFSETVGYKIQGPNKTALFIPDIDKWQKWSIDIRQMIKDVDYAFLDATFFDNNELKNRDMSEVPHPFVTESMTLFSTLAPNDKAKVIFIHFNHSNPLLNINSKASQLVLSNGFNVAFEGLKVAL